MKVFINLPKALKSPYPFNYNIVRNLIACVLFGAFIFFFLLVFKPFGLQKLSGAELIYLTLGYGLVTSGYLIIHQLILGYFFNQDIWTARKDIINTLIIIVMIGLFNYLYHSIYFSKSFSIIALLELQLQTLAISFIPVSGITLLKQNFLLKKYIKEADAINKRNNYILKNNCEDKLITISAHNPKNNFSCRSKDIIYLQAMDNYVVVNYYEGREYTKEIIRTSLKKAKEDLKECPNFFHCHKSYLINLDRVNKVSGNAQGLKLHFADNDEIIPVSRRLNQELKQIFGTN